MPKAIVTGLTSYRYWDADGSRRFAGMGETVEVLDKEDFKRGVSEGWIAPLPETKAAPKDASEKAAKKSRKNKKTKAAPKDADQAANGEPVASEGAGEPVSQSAGPETPPE